MLPESGNRPSLNKEELDREIEEIVKIGKLAGERISDFMQSGEPFILHAGTGLPGAAALKAYLQGLSWGKVPPFLSVTDFLYGTLPYAEEKLKVVFFMGSARERNLAVSLISGLEVMNADFIIVTPLPEDPILRERASSESFVSVSGTPDPVLTEIIASSFAGLSYAEKRGLREDMRIYRLRNELASLNEVYTQLLYERCGELADLVSQAVDIDVVYTPFLQSSAFSLYYKFLGLGKKVRIIDSDSTLPFVEALSSTVLLFTSVEEASLRELLLRLQKGKKIAKLLRFNTDPLSALIYASFFSRCFAQ